MQHRDDEHAENENHSVIAILFINMVIEIFIHILQTNCMLAKLLPSSTIE